MKSELKSNPKFKRLCRLVRLPAPYVAGLLEFLWQVGYEQANDVIGDAVDVEVASEWPGEPGEWAKLLLSEKWIGELSPGRFFIHDFWDHVPQYVDRKRARREAKEERSDLTSHRLANGDIYPTQPNPTQPIPQPPHAPRAESPPEGGLEGREPVVPKRTADAAPEGAAHRPSLQSGEPVTPGGVADATLRSAADAPPKAGAAEPPGFARFWEAYPPIRKSAKSKCLRIWQRAKLEAKADEILGGLGRWKVSRDWAKEGGQFIPGPEPFLNGEKWLALPKPVSGGGSAAGVEKTRQLLAEQATKQRDVDERVWERDRVLATVSRHELDDLAREVIKKAGRVGETFVGKDPRTYEPLRWKIYELVNSRLQLAGSKT